LTRFSTGSILQRKKTLQRRRKSVNRQLALWPEAQNPPQETAVWQELDLETKRTIIATLSRIISKAVSSENLTQIKENSHERQ
jgi:hypothetical protein